MSQTPHELTPEIANSWLELAIGNIQQEYPHYTMILADARGAYPLHRESHPVFFGSFDWHSCVEMYWVAARLMQLFPGLPAEAEAIAVINSLLTTDHIAQETVYCQQNPGFERPYGWGWLLKLQHGLDIWRDPRGEQWGAILRPLTQQFVEQYLAWLPKLTYPQRIGMHANTAFALMLSLPYARASAPGLAELIDARSHVWFGDDALYPFAYEPSGADFLSAGLTEAVLVKHVLPEQEFTAWIRGYLPPVDSEWLTPAVVSDPTDGQIAHLHGLNLSRAWALGELAAAIPDRADELRSMRDEHIQASIDAVVGEHYMVAHWVVAYALLLSTEP